VYQIKQTEIVSNKDITIPTYLISSGKYL